jgi:ABC-type bacteriocin/lantibiotic exporter with double-glycine peptidase domain
VQLNHQFGRADEPLSRVDLVRAARYLNLKAKSLDSSCDRLRSMPLPAIAEDKHGRHRLVQERLLAEQVNEYVAQHETLGSQRRERVAEQASVEAERLKLEKTLPLISRRAEALRKLS